MLCLCLFHFFLFASCTVLLICLFFLIPCSHRCCFYFLWKGYELSGEIALKNNNFYHYYYYNLPTSIIMGNTQIPFKQSSKNLGSTFDCHPTMFAHVSNIARTCYIELHRLASFGMFATVYKSTLGSNITFKTNFDFTHTSFEVVQASITLQHNTLHFFCLYRPPPNRRNNLTDSMFTEQLPDLLDYVNSLPGFVCLVGDMNIHFDNPLQSLTKQTLSTLSLYDLVQVINKPTHRCGHIIDWVIVRPDDDIHRKSTVTDSLESDHYCTKSYFNISVEKPSTLYRTVRNIANIDRPSFIADLSSVSEFSSVENANQFCDFLRTVLDKHAPPSLRKVITHSSSPWFESIRDELFIAKRERRQAERKWMNTKLIIFKDLYRQAKHKVSKLVHTAKCKFYTERIALASSSKELHQIVNTLSNRHPPKILPTIYPSADLPSIFIKHFTNKVEKLRANIASEHVTSTLVTGTTAATFSSFEKVSQLTVKECILSSAPKSCELDPIPSKLLIECLDSILPSLTDLFNSSLASGIFPQISSCHTNSQKEVSWSQWFEQLSACL